jgi:thioredoxin 1
MSKPIEVNESKWEQEVQNAKGLVLVDFWAVWCGPCKMVAPIVDELSTEYEGRVKVAKLNTDENPGIASRYQIMGIPTLLFFKDGKPVDKIVGAAPKKQYKDKIDTLLAQ